MNGRFLLDTSIVVELFAGDAGIQARLALAAEVFVPIIVLGELVYGALRSAKVSANLAQVSAFAAGTTVLVCDAGTAEHYGEIKNLLRTKGQPIPDNDIWIAAVAQQHGLTLACRDQHFNSIDGLLVEQW